MTSEWAQRLHDLASSSAVTSSVLSPSSDHGQKTTIRYSAATTACPASSSGKIGPYLHLLNEALLGAGCKLHAYVLMENHVHLVLTPPDTGRVAVIMQKLERSYVGQFNARHRRTGTFWEGRYKSCLVDTQSYLVHCYRYIELNPVRARMTDDPTT